jgi:hypothetical protein
MTFQAPFRITVPHEFKAAGNFHMWFFPNGWRGIGPTVRCDIRGYRQGLRKGYYPEWFVLACNNSDCPAQAVVPVRLIIDHADKLDPDVGEWKLW